MEACFILSVKGDTESEVAKAIRALAKEQSVKIAWIKGITIETFAWYFSRTGQVPYDPIADLMKNALGDENIFFTAEAADWDSLEVFSNDLQIFLR